MTAAMDHIDRIRQFNRFYTRFMGLLARDYLATGLSLTEVRALHELAEAPQPSARAIAQALDIDEGYLSRVIERFRAKGWTERAVDPTDRRRRILVLTEAGRAAYAPLARRAREDIAARLATLPPGTVPAATEAMARLQTLLTAPADVTLRDLECGDTGWLIEAHAKHYAESDGFNFEFEALVAEILADFLRNRDPAKDRAFIAVRGAERLGSIFCVRGDAPEVAKLRLFYLVPEARGLGLGKRLLAACLAFARAAGYRRMALWTHETHRAAGALYAASGFRMTATEPVRSFGQDMVRQSWEIHLAALAKRQAES